MCKDKCHNMQMYANHTFFLLMGEYYNLPLLLWRKKHNTFPTTTIYQTWYFFAGQYVKEYPVMGLDFHGLGCGLWCLESRIPLFPNHISLDCNQSCFWGCTLLGMILKFNNRIENNKIESRCWRPFPDI